MSGTRSGPCNFSGDSFNLNGMGQGKPRDSCSSGSSCQLLVPIYLRPYFCPSPVQMGVTVHKPADIDCHLLPFSHEFLYQSGSGQHTNLAHMMRRVWHSLHKWESARSWQERWAPRGQRGKRRNHVSEPWWDLWPWERGCSARSCGHAWGDIGSKAVMMQQRSGASKYLNFFPFGPSYLLKPNGSWREVDLSEALCRGQTPGTQSGREGWKVDSESRGENKAVPF